MDGKQRDKSPLGAQLTPSRLAREVSTRFVTRIVLTAQEIILQLRQRSAFLGRVSIQKRVASSCACHFQQCVRDTHLLLQSYDTRPLLLQQLRVFRLGIWCVIDIRLCP